MITNLNANASFRRTYPIGFFEYINLPLYVIAQLQPLLFVRLANVVRRRVNNEICGIVFYARKCTGAIFLIYLYVA